MRRPPGAGRILIVDDTEAICDLYHELLTFAGYEVTKSTSSVDALRLFKERPAEFDLVITDQSMPDMTGEELAKAVLAIRPELPIVLMSGFPEETHQDDVRKAGIREYLQKPIQLGTLIHTAVRYLPWNTNDDANGL